MKKNQPIESTINTFITSNFSFLLSIIGGVILARSLGPEGKGIWGALLLVIKIYSPILFFAYYGGVLYYGLKKILDIQRFFYTGLLISFGMGLIISFLIYSLTTFGLFGELMKNNTEDILLPGILSIPVFIINLYLIRVNYVFHLFKAANYRDLISVSFLTLTYLLFWQLGHLDLKLVALAFLLSQILQLFLNIGFIIKYVNPKRELQWGNSLVPWKYGLKEWLNQIIAQANDKFDQIVLTFLLSAQSFGLYLVGVGVSNLALKIPSSYLSVLSNQIIQKNVKDGLALYSRAQRITIIFTLSVSVLIASFSYFLIVLLYGKEFANASYVVFYYAPGLMFQIAARLTVKFYASQGKPLKNSVIYLIGLLVSIPFYFALIPKMGINGAALASSISYFSSFLFSFYQIRKDYGVRLQEILIPQVSDFVYVKNQLLSVPQIRKYLG